MHGVAQLREANVDFALVCGRQIKLLDSKALHPGRYAIRRRAALPVETPESWRLRAQVTDGAFYDALVEPNGRVGSSLARMLQSQARELVLAADLAGIDITVDTCLVLVLDSDFARIETPDGAPAARPWTRSFFAFPDGRPLVVGSPLTTTVTQLADVLARECDQFAAPAPEVRAWLTEMRESSKRRRLARIEKELAEGSTFPAMPARERA